MGLLFDRNFEVSPPFGGNKATYEALFSDAFHLKTLETCTNSVTPRAETELFFVFQKKSEVEVQCYSLTGITCSNCTKTVLQKITALAGVIAAQINSSFTDLVVVSTAALGLQELKDVLAYEPEYTIKEIK